MVWWCFLVSNGLPVSATSKGTSAQKDELVSLFTCMKYSDTWCKHGNLYINILVSLKKNDTRECTRASMVFHLPNLVLYLLLRHEKIVFFLFG